MAVEKHKQFQKIHIIFPILNVTEVMELRLRILSSVFRFSKIRDC